MNGNDKLKQIIGNAKNILVVTSESINVDLLSSQLVFAQILSSTGKKRVDVLADTRFTNSFHQIVDKFSSLSIKDRILPHLTVISINNSPDDLDGIEWKKEKDKLNLFVRTKEGSTLNKSDVTFAEEVEHYDLIVTIGLSSLNDLGALYDDNTSFFEDTTILNIEIHEAEEETGDYEVRDAKSTTYSELVYEIIGSLKLNLNKDQATTLLLGVYSGTNNFSKVKNPKTFDSAARLTALGGDINFITSFLEDSKSNTFELKQRRIRKTTTEKTIPNVEVKPVKQSEDKQKAEVKPAQKPMESSQQTESASKVQPQQATQQQDQRNLPSQPVQPAGNAVSPLQKATSIPTMQPTNTENQNMNNFGSPNFMQPPPINPTKTTSFAPLTPKRKG